MEQIIRIEEASFKRCADDWSSFDGYQIVTTNQTIKVGIENGQACCENWGHLISNDEVKEFEGADLVAVSITDTALNHKKVEELSVFEGGIMFVNLQTSKGLLQFVCYNEHNGYYGHEAVVISEQLNHSETL